MSLRFSVLMSLVYTKEYMNITRSNIKILVLSKMVELMLGSGI